MKSPKPARLLEQWLTAQAAGEARALTPLPTTRALGKKFRTSHGTAFRVLCRLEKQGVVWRHANGRFYPAWARRALERPKPLAVLLRRMTSWSVLCREVMEGFTDECGARDRSLLLVHNGDLVAETGAGDAISVAPLRRQEEMLRDFLLLHGDSCGGVLFDELWSDRAIRRILPPSLPAVVFHRPAEGETVGSVAADFRAGARLALDHLLACQYRTLYFIEPFADYPSARLFLQAAREVFRELSGRDFPGSRQIAWHHAAGRTAFLQKLASAKTRCGLICPEDNTSQQIHDSLCAAGIPLGPRHGLVSVMGTSAIPPGHLTCVRYDFRHMGRLAGQMLSNGKPETALISPRLETGSSTSAA